MNDRQRQIKKDISNFRRKVSRRASVANKRLDRLAKLNIDSDAYNRWVKEGSIRFGVKGKTTSQVVAELDRIEHFLQMESATVKGAKRIYQETIKNIGADTTNTPSFTLHTGNFFALASKLSQLLESANEAALALDYHKIWKAINTYVSKSMDSINDLENDGEDLLGAYKELVADIQEDAPKDVVMRLSHSLGDVEEQTTIRGNR